MRPRTLKDWEKLAGETSDRRPVGRPPHSAEAHEKAQEVVRAAAARLGHRAGETLVHGALAGAVPLRLVRWALRAVKAQHRAEQRRERAARRSHVAVHARDALWSQDATHVGRDERGVAVEADVVREVASGATLEVAVGPAACARDAIAALERAAQAHGSLPLVLATDNGVFASDEVQAWLAAHEIVHLASLPRTPQHNPWVEHGHAELKGETGLGKGVRVRCLAATRYLLAMAVRRLDGARRRASRAWRTAREMLAVLPRATALLDRSRFYRATRCAIDQAVLDCRSARERRLRTRTAILETMERASPSLR